MRFLLPDELPSPALAAVHESLERDGEDPANWSVRSVWESDRKTFAVVMRWDDETRSYTVVPEGGGFTAWDVTE